MIGNNDVVYHDQAPLASFAEEYYTTLWEMMFEDIPANAAIATNDTIYETWMQGGYYVYEIGDDIMVLCINGMYPFYENWAEQYIADEMIDWIEATLEANPDKYFITQTHVFFGNNWYEGLEVLWNSTYTNRLM